jgi:hypothetical protein
MSDPWLTQADADALLAMEKQRVDETTYDYPALGGGLHIPLQSLDKRETFVLDVVRGRVRLTKGTYQNRARSTVILARLDFDGPSHRNPDDEEITTPHLHLYREGYGDRWAFPLPLEHFAHPTDPWELLNDFMRFVNITTAPAIQRGLFL